MTYATKLGTFSYRVVLFGLNNALATYQQLMSHIIKEFYRNFWEVYVDDLCVHS